MFAVLSGDIVSSQKLTTDQLERSISDVEMACNTIQYWPGVTKHGFARYRGDGWQLAFNVPAYALRAALYIQASLKSQNPTWATKIAIATGKGTMPDGDPNKGQGDAFVRSGRLLDNLPRVSLINHTDSHALSAVAILFGQISSGWKQAQARIIKEHLVPNAGPSIETAEKFSITRQAVDQSLRSAGFRQIEAALDALESEQAP